jgi:hypothetical protein
MRSASINGSSRAQTCLRRCARGFAVVLIAATATGGQTTRPQGWTFVVTPYGWLAGLDGQLGIRTVMTNVDLSFADIAPHLRFGAMGTFEARKGPIVFATDVMYISLGGAKAFAFRGGSGEISFGQRETILQPVVGYGFGGQSWSVDVLAGARYWNLSADLGIDPTRLSSVTRSGTVDWLDATGGLRARVTPKKGIHLTAEGDGGGGGSRSSWQAVGIVGADLSRHWGAMAGYRYLTVDYDRSGFLMNTHMDGWLLGVSANF